MRYRIYDDGGDDQVFEIRDGEARQTSKNKFVLTGFNNGIHPYHAKQLAWIDLILQSSGIYLHHVYVPTVIDIGNCDSGEFTPKNMKIPDRTWKVSADGNVYILFQDVEMGRGWAVLLKMEGTGRKEILTQDHRDTVREEFLLQGEWIRSFGIDYAQETVKNLKVVE